MKYLKLIILISILEIVLCNECGPLQKKSCEDFLKNNNKIGFCDNQDREDIWCCHKVNYETQVTNNKIGMCMSDDGNCGYIDKCKEFFNIHDKINYCGKQRSKIFCQSI